MIQHRLAFALLAVFVLLTSHFYAYQTGGKNHTAALRLEYAAQQAEATKEAIVRERSLQLKVKEAQDAAVLRQNLLLADASRARAESGRLRDSLADIQRKLPSLTEQAVRSYADAASIVLGECQGKYQELAEQADRIDSDRQTLEAAWPKE